MDTLTLTLPTMYGDHHVIEVRRILLAESGITEVQASSCFQVVQVTYEPDQITPDDIKAKLEDAGYLEELPMPLETGQAAYGRDESVTFFRHTAAYEQTKLVVGFAQEVQSIGRPLWPCPGMGPIRTAAEN